MNVDAPAESSSFSLANFTLANLSSDGIERTSVSGLNLQTPMANASLGRFELSGFVFPDVHAMIGMSSSMPMLEDAAARTEFARSVLAAMPRLDHVGIHDLSAGEGAEPLITLASATLDFSEWNEIFAGATDLAIDGLALSKNLPGIDEQTLQMMNSLGYDNLIFDGSLTDRWDAESGRDEAVWTASLQNGADVEVSYSLTGLTAEWVLSAIAASYGDESEHAMMKLLSRVALEGATVRTTDRSLLDRAFTTAAQLQGLTVDGPAYREQIRGALPFMLSSAIPAQIASLVATPLQEFMAGGQTLVADIAPDSPISLLAMSQLADSGDPTQAVEALGLTLHSEPATSEMPAEEPPPLPTPSP
jgi:hypothetical protein